MSSYKLGSIPNISQRMEAFIFISTFDTRKGDLIPDIINISRCTEFIHSNQKIKKLLEVILHVGNFLNSGNNRLKDAFGFKLETFDKLIDTKTTDNSMTMVEVIVDMLRESDQMELVNFPKSEIEIVETGARVSLPTIMAEFTKIIKEYETLGTIATTVEKVSDDDIFLEKLQSFLNENNGMIEQLKQDVAKMNVEFENLVKLFAEDPSQTDPENFFGKWKKFLSAISDSNKKIETEKEKREKDRKRDEAKRLNEEKKNKKKPKGGEDNNQTDDAYGEMKSGNVFAQRRKKNENNQNNENNENVEVKKR